MIQAIETSYNGYRFRSRLEARWAVFFDALAVDWAYEYEGFALPIGGYLPDFLIRYYTPPGVLAIAERRGTIQYIRERYDLWIEIKGPRPTLLELERVRLVAKETDSYAMVINNVPGNENMHVSMRGAPMSIVPDDKRRVTWSNLLWLIGAGIESAYAAARSARFEHGETPRVLRGRQNA